MGNNNDEQRSEHESQNKLLLVNDDQLTTHLSTFVFLFFRATDADGNHRQNDTTPAEKARAASAIVDTDSQGTSTRPSSWQTSAPPVSLTISVPSFSFCRPRETATTRNDTRDRVLNRVTVAETKKKKRNLNRPNLSGPAPRRRRSPLRLFLIALKRIILVLPDAE